VEQFHVRFCFPDALTADAFRKGFGGTRLTSSPGTPQGLALYMQGIRVNETSGDTVNWDMIP
jgi:hypothetical protein